MSLSFGVAVASLATAIFIPDRFHASEAETIHGIHHAFVLLGALIELSGLARTLIDFMASLLGHVRGGLGIVVGSDPAVVHPIVGHGVAESVWTSTRSPVAQSYRSPSWTS